MTIKDDVQAVFAQAIDARRLSADPRDWNYAGHYMYMGTDNGIDAFKHGVTRLYLE